jgi:hypothetical protein
VIVQRSEKYYPSSWVHVKIQHRAREEEFIPLTAVLILQKNRMEGSRFIRYREIRRRPKFNLRFGTSFVTFLIIIAESIKRSKTVGLSLSYITGREINSRPMKPT